MTDKRLNEIKDSIEFQLEITKSLGVTDELLEEAKQLYNEVVELRDQNDKIFFLLERIQQVLPLYYGDMHREIQFFLDKNRA